ncbi:hypothetical protein NEOLEDRAFT_1141292 [Neolentinus lepideus HHB14362 ss-1]|uniref:Uncharacterized protein n=1 Tax=Neolentinus lepideus HHB14362 ss-1 TaxID=1314782 RepID=A0A165NQY9_9AGAM|nr:hypothetical protein NEOLEDRAFT_1141292 [Neolentinus lepideus HHB14362 ss-1]
MYFDNNTTRTTGNSRDFHQPVEGELANYSGSQASESGWTNVPGIPPVSGGEGFSNPGQMYGEGLRAQQQHTHPEHWDVSRPDAQGGINSSQRETDGLQQSERRTQGVPVNDRITGNAEKLAGHATFNAGLREKGEERKTGQL